MTEGLNCYVDHLIRSHADEMGQRVMQEDAETTAIEQAVTRFLQDGGIRYGSAGTARFTLEDLNHFIYDDDDLARCDEKAARTLRKGFGYPAGSSNRHRLHQLALQQQDALTYRAAVAMLQPHASYLAGHTACA